MNEKDNLFFSNNIGYNYYILLEMLKEDNTNINLIILIIEICVELYLYDEAKKYINYLRYNLNYNSKRIMFLENKVNEIESNYKEDIIFKYNIVGVKDIELYDSYYEQTNNPDYLYVKAKKMYENNLLEESMYLFNSYIKLGKRYIREAYIFLFFISFKLSDENNYNIYLNILNDLFEYKNINYSLEGILLTYIDNYTDNICLDISKYIIKDEVISNEAYVIKKKK